MLKLQRTPLPHRNLRDKDKEISMISAFYKQLFVLSFKHYFAQNRLNVCIKTSVFAEPSRRAVMTQHELKHLRRTDLLEMLLEQNRENEELRSQIEQLQEQQSKRAIMLNKAGSIAEAALQLNGVFEAAQSACDQYIDSVEQLYAQQRVICDRMEQETKAKCQIMVQDAKEECDRMLARAKCQADAYWSDLFDKMRNNSDSSAMLRALFSNKTFWNDKER